jgi:hypothetical protein
MSNETKETAVEWLYLEIYKFLNGKSEFQDANDILQQAKEMEKEQMIEFARTIPIESGILQEGGAYALICDPEQYYNETYGGNE